MPDFTRPRKKTNTKKRSKRNLEKALLYLRFLKILKITFHIFIFLFVIYIIFLFKKEEALFKIKNNLSNIYSNLIYNDICTNIEINGVEMVNVKDLEEKIYDFCSLDNKNNLSLLAKNILADPWIKNLSIKREIPDTLIINIEEFLPFAIWKTDNNIHLIDEEGKIILIPERDVRKFSYLIIVAGDGAKDNIYSLFNMLSSNSSLFSRIKSALFIGKRRWNLELDNGIIVKMPEENLMTAWTRLDKILSINGSEIDIKSIDLRNSNKVFIEKSNYPSNHDWFILRLFQEITDFVENGFLAGALYAGNIIKDCQNLQNIKIRTIWVI